MSKKVACELWLCGQFKMINIGKFKSLSECHRYIDECVNEPYKIVRLHSKKYNAKVNNI